MRIQRTSRIITAAIIVLSMLAIVCAVVARHYRSVQESLYETRRKMSHFAEQLASGSDRLTTAVRAYAATGDRRHYDAFQRELTVERSRDAAVEGLRRLGLAPEELSLISRAKLNSDNLVDLENQAFAAVASNQTARAVQIVYGPEYENAKTSIMGPIAECRQRFEHRLSTQAAQLATRADLLANAALGLLILNAATMGIALVLFYGRRVVNPLSHLNASLRGLVARTPGARIGYQDDPSELGEVARSMETYRVTVEEAERQRWVKGSVAEISEALQGAEQPDEFGRRLLSHLVPLVGGGCGAFHLLLEADGRFHFISGYGCERPGHDAGFSPGQGFPGQAALERKTLVLSDLPPDYIRIGSGLGGAPPRMLGVVPLMTQDRVLAVVELASFAPLTDQQRELVDEVASMAALKLEVLQRNLATRELLEQVRASEEHTRETEQFFRSVLELAPDGLMVVDAHGIIRLANAQSEVLFGYTREELIGQPVELLVPDDVRGRHQGLRRGFHDAPAARDMGAGRELRGLRKNGTLFPVEIGLSPLPGRQNQGEQVAVSIRDITERKRTEQELAYRLAFQHALLETIPYPMFIKDAEGRFAGCNKAYEREFGTTSSALKGKTVLDLEYLPEADRRKFHDEDMAVIQEASRRSYELPIRYADGQVHTTLYSVDGFRLSDGSAGGLIGLLVDISDQKRVAEELRQAKAKAEEATEMKSMFLANMSHEIRTPMNAIIGLSHLALKTQLNAKQRDYISKVHNAGTSLLAVINDILDFSKIEAGKLELECTDFKLDEVISSVTTLTAQKAHEKGLEFLAHVAPGIPEHLAGDPLRLGQILTNFVNNAVKFTEQGEIRLEIELLERTGEKVQLKFSVRDTGMGMTREQSARLFQPFTQADMSTTRKHGGTGLGLTICRRLVELMGGRIWLESEPGVGSTFFFNVWLGVGSAPGSGKVVPERLARLRVLVVDDNPAAREILQEPLSSLARQVDAASSGTEAIAAVRQHDATDPYDLVFMDWRMPGMDGLQASRHIKSDETLRRPPAIVLVTAFGREEVREEAERLELDGFLLKPVTKSMIVDTLVNVFGAGGEQPSADADGGQETRLRGARLLLVEDNEINQQIAVELLQGAGASVQVANNGRLAVERLFEGPQPPRFDAVLMDLQMPEMDGFQATARIRADPRFKTLPIIAMTAHATIEERQRCLAAGMNDHIPKPIDPATLFEIVSRFYQPGTAPSGASPDPRRVEPPAPAFREIPRIAGLDTADGLARVGGNQKLYLKLLRQFADEQAATVPQMRAALSQGDRSLAERLAHTLKGVAGNIGATPVQIAAGALEKSIREQGEPAAIESATQHLSAVLDPLLAALRATGAQPTHGAPPADVIPVDPARCREVAGHLAKLLSEFDPAATEFIETQSGVLRGLFDEEGWSGFARNVRNYAFAEAQAQLGQALGKLPPA